MLTPVDHVIEIERNKITVKEIYCAQYCILHFRNILKVMITYLDFEVVRKFNYFPVKGGLSPYYKWISEKLYAKVCENIIDEFTIKTQKSQAVARLAIKDIFKVDGSKLLNTENAELFHTIVARVFL